MPTTPYRISVSNEILADLKSRLASTRYPDDLPGTPWSRGMDLAVLREVVEYWQHTYDWRAHETRLNGIPQFTANVDNVDIHFFHVRSGANATPLLLLHGWPGSPVEFLDMIEPLTVGTTKHSFDLVIPTIPGFGFSGKPQEEGWGVDRVADAFDHLMVTELGYATYGIQGGDWGGLIGTAMSQRHADHVTGLHLNLALALPPQDADPADIQRFMSVSGEYQKKEAAYADIQTSKPLSLTVAQADSPAGLAAWILEKFHGWSDLNGTLLDTIPIDNLITNLMFYWAPNSIASAAAMYYESFGVGTLDYAQEVTVPVAFARFPGEMAPVVTMPDEWFPTRYNIKQMTHFDKGGHFAAMEQPDALASDVQKFFAELGSPGTQN